MSQPRFKTNTLIKNALMATPLLAALPAPTSLADIIAIGDNSYGLDNAHHPGDSAYFGQAVFGQTGSGTLAINGGSIFEMHAVILGKQATGHGSVSVDGTGSMWQVHNLTVGEYGTGELNITQGGNVHARSLAIAPALNAQGTVTVDGPGSQLIVDYPSAGSTVLAIGSTTASNSSLNIINGGLVDARNANVYNTIADEGYLHFDNGTLLARSVDLNTSRVTGTGTIHTLGNQNHAGALTFNAATGNQYTQTFTDNLGRVLTMHVDLSGTDGVGDFGFDPSVQSALLIDGTDVHMGNVSLDNDLAAPMPVTVTNQGVWHVSTLRTAGTGSVNLTIENGGQLTGANVGFEGEDQPSSLLVTGTGSALNLSSSLHLTGNRGHHFEINDGATANTRRVSIIDTLATTHITGAGTQLSTEGELRIAGGFVVDNGAEINSDSAVFDNTQASLGHALFTGEQTRWTNTNDLTIGQNNNATLTLDDGVQVNTGSIGLGTTSWGEGTLVVDGPGTQLTTGALRVGSEGDGHLIVTNGAAVTATSFGSGAYQSQTNSTVLISGVNTTFRAKATQMPSYGTAQMTVEDGAFVQLGETILGSAAQSTGTLIVTNPGTRVDITGNLLVGNNGEGLLSVADGASVHVAGTTEVGKNDNPMGTIALAGGTFHTQKLEANGQQITGFGDLYTETVEGDFEIHIDGTNDGDAWFPITQTNGDTVRVHTQLGDQSAAQKLLLAREQQASFHLSNGAEIWTNDSFLASSNNTMANASVTGPNTTWHELGDFRLAEGNNTQGDLLVSGDNAKLLVSDQLAVGRSGPVQVTVADGGLIEAGSFNLGWYEEDSSLDIEGPNSQVRVHESFYNHGTLNIADGGAFESTDFTSSGNMFVSGPDTVFNVTQKFRAFRPQSTEFVFSNGAQATVKDFETLGPYNTEPLLSLELHGPNTNLAVENNFDFAGNLLVTHGATLETNKTNIANVSPINALVSGEGSQWIVHNNWNLLAGISVADGAELIANQTLVIPTHETNASILLDHGQVFANSLDLKSSNLRGTGVVHTRGSQNLDGFNLIFGENAHGIAHAALNQAEDQNIDLVYDWSNATNAPNATFGLQGETNIQVESGNHLWTGWTSLGSDPSHAATTHVNGEGTHWQAIHLQLGSGQFNLSQGAALTVDTTEVATNNGHTGTMALSGPGTHMDTRLLTVGGTGQGTFRMSEAATANANALTIGNSAASVASEVSLDGPGTRLDVSDLLSLAAGEHQISVSNQATLSALGGIDNQGGNIVLNNATIKTGHLQTSADRLKGDGEIFAIGLSGYDNLVLTSDANHSQTAHFTHNNQAASTGIKVVMDLSNPNNTAPLHASGNASLAFNDIGDIATGNTTLAGASQGNASIELSGSDTSWQVNGNLSLGANGPSTLTVHNGSRMQVHQAINLGPNGNMLLSGPGTTLTSGSAFNMAGGSSVRLENQAALRLNSDFNFASTPNTPATLHVNGGTLDMQNHAIRAERNSAPYALILDSGTIQNASSISGMGTLIQNGGTMASENRITVIGDYAMNGGTLKVDTNQAISFNPMLNVQGTFSIGETGDAKTTLSLSRPTLFQSYTFYSIIQARNSTGAFDQIEGIQIDDNHAWATLYQDGNLVIGAVTPGDLNLDRKVDLDDLTVLGTFYGTNGTWVNGDVNGDGEVDLNDLTILGTFYGAGTSSQMDFAQALQITGLAQVPEPMSASLLMGGMLAMVHRRRRTA